MAKNKILRYLRAFVGGYNLSGDARTFSSMENTYEPVEMTGWSEAVKNSLADGWRQVGIKGFQVLLNDAAAGAWTILRQTNATSRQVSMLFGSGAEPAIGDPAYLLGAIQMGDPVTLDSGKPVLTTDFLPDASQYSANADNPLGKVISPEISLAATTNQASVDNGASSTAGGHANLQVTASSGGTWAFKIQHSPDNSSWADLITFTINGSAVASEHKTVAGTINQYVRFVATRTSGTVTPVCAFARN